MSSACERSFRRVRVSASPQNSPVRSRAVMTLTEQPLLDLSVAPVGVHDETGRVWGSAAVRDLRGIEPEVLAGFAFDPRTQTSSTRRPALNPRIMRGGRWRRPLDQCDFMATASGTDSYC